MERRGGHEVLLLVKELLTTDSCQMVLSRVYTWDRIKYTNINAQSYSYLLLFAKLSKIHIRENITLLAYDDIKTGCAYIKINFKSRKDYKVRPGTLTLIASRISRVQFKIQT